MEKLSVHQKIAVLRKMRGLKRSQLAEMLTVSDDTVRTWEKGSRTPDSFHLIDLGTVFNVSLDVFRDDALTLDLPRPNFNQNDLSFANTPLRFGSTEPNTKQKEILDFYSAYLETLDSAFFVKGAGQNSEHGTGRYFWEKQIDMLMFIGFVPRFEKEHPECAFSVSVNTETPLPKDTLTEYNALQITDNAEENWLYVPISCDLKKNGALYPKKLREATDKALVCAMKIARESLESTMQKFIALKATANHTKDRYFEG